MPKSRYSRKSTSRSAPVAKRSSRKTTQPYSSRLTIDQKLNFIGGVLAVVGVISLVALFANKNGQLTGWIARTTGQIAGWGGIILPAAMIIAGLTLLFRHYERLPHVSGGRIGGVVLLYLNLLTWFHFFTGGGYTSAREGRGGGFIGAGLDDFLYNTLGRAGEVVVLVAWLLISILFIVNISLPELIRQIGVLIRKFEKRRVPKFQHQQEFNYSQSKSTSSVDTSDSELPDGFNPLNLTEASTPAEPVVRRHETIGRSSAAGQNTPLAKPSETPVGPAPVVRTAASKPVKPWPIPAVADILDPASPAAMQSHYDKDRARIIEETLASFGAPSHIVEIHRGPAVTQYGVEPDFIESRSGRTRVRVAKIVNLADDLALALAAPSIRIQAPVPGKAYVGIEVPNSELTLVSLRELIETDAFKKVKSSLRFAFGKDVAGKPVCADLTNMPHLLVAGTTNSGKSVLVNAILTSLLLNNSPQDLRLVLVDPKRVELTGYNGIPHLLAPVVVDAERVVGALQWVLREMDSRYKRFANAGARNISDFNRKSGEHIPYLVIVIDELADLMMLAPDETERSITRLAQLARATGIHLIISTQRPSVDVVTGLIKANFPARVAFMVASGTDSRVILDQPGAERLLGRGDMLYQAPDAPAPVRLQGVYVSDPEIQRLVNAWRLIAMNRQAEEGDDLYDASLEMVPPGLPLKQGSFFGDEIQSTDPMLREAMEVVRREGKASISMLQRRLRVGYNRAARLIDSLEDQKIIGPQQSGSQVREVLDFGESSAEQLEES